MNIKEYLDILKDLWTPTNASKIRMSISNALEMMGNNLKENIDRQDNIENQFQDVLDETAGKDIINGPEIIAARNGEANLKARLDKEHQKVTAQLAQTEIVVSKTEPSESHIWYEDRGESGLEVSTGSALSISNAIVSENEIDDETKIWFDK